MSVVPPLSKLYLCQVFSGYFLRQQRNQELQAFLTGLEVLEEKLTAFQQKQLQWVDKLASRNDSIPMPSVVVPISSEANEQDGLNIRFQSIYDRIKSLMQVEDIILERMTFEVKRSESSKQPRSKTPIPTESEEQLYRLVGEIRQKLSMAETKTEQYKNDLEELMQKFQKSKEELSESLEVRVSLKNELNRSQQRMIGLESQLRDKDTQISSLLAQKVEFIQRIQKIEKTLQETQSSLQNRETELKATKDNWVKQQQQIASFKQTLEVRMAKMQEELRQENKKFLADKENQEIAAINVFKRVFVGSNMKI